MKFDKLILILLILTIFLYFLLSWLGPIYFSRIYNVLHLLNEVVMGVLTAAFLIMRFSILVNEYSTKKDKLSNRKLGKKLLSLFKNMEHHRLYTDNLIDIAKKRLKQYSETEIDKIVDELIDCNLIKIEKDGLKVTESGQQFLNSLF